MAPELNRHQNKTGSKQIIEPIIKVFLCIFCVFRLFEEDLSVFTAADRLNTASLKAL